MTRLIGVFMGLFALAAVPALAQETTAGPGTVEVTVNGVSAWMKEGSVLYWATNDKRTIRNLGTTPATYHVVKVLSAKSPK